MGLLSLFGKGPMSAAKIEKVSKLASNPFAQPDVRMREMHRLIQDGSEAAIRGVLKRFDANAQGHIADEDEKKWLENALVDLGRPALGPLADYILTGDKLTYALRAYKRIAGNDASSAFFIATLEKLGPEDYRAAEAKLQIVWQLGEELSDARVLPALVPFLHDHSDDVRWAVMDLLVRKREAGPLDAELAQKASAALAELVVKDDVGPRIQRRAAEILADNEWLVSGEAPALAKLLDEDFFLDKKRFVRRRAKKT